MRSPDRYEVVAYVPGWVYRGLLTERSPIRHLYKYSRPLLILTDQMFKHGRQFNQWTPLSIKPPPVSYTVNRSRAGERRWANVEQMVWTPLSELVPVQRTSLGPHTSHTRALLQYDNITDMQMSRRVDDKLKLHLFLSFHYPGTISLPRAKHTGLQIWSSEDYSTFNDLHGASCWARVCHVISILFVLQVHKFRVLICSFLHILMSSCVPICQSMSTYVIMCVYMSSYVHICHTVSPYVIICSYMSSYVPHVIL